MAERVGRMRDYLGINARKESPFMVHEVADPFKAAEETACSGKHQRYDSGSHEHSGIALQELTKLHAPSISESFATETITLLSLHRDFLSHSLFRIRKRNSCYLLCVCCNTTHKEALHEGTSVVWLLQGCRHYVHAACFDKLHDNSSGAGSCYNCDTFKRMVKSCGPKEMGMRHERLLESTSRNL